MWDFVVAHWCFAPYVACLCLLAVMSVREGAGEKTPPRERG
jgi:hypothetical protein